jgi:hypothetical protein
MFPAAASWVNIDWTPIEGASGAYAQPGIVQIPDVGANTVIVIDGDGGATSLGNLALRAQNANAAAVVVVSSVCESTYAEATSTAMERPGVEGSQVNIPVYTVEAAQGRRLIKAIEDNGGAAEISLTTGYRTRNDAYMLDFCPVGHKAFTPDVCPVNFHAEWPPLDDAFGKAWRKKLASAIGYWDRFAELQHFQQDTLPLVDTRTSGEDELQYAMLNPVHYHTEDLNPCNKGSSHNCPIEDGTGDQPYNPKQMWNKPCKYIDSFLDAISYRTGPDFMKHSKTDCLQKMTDPQFDPCNRSDKNLWCSYPVPGKGLLRHRVPEAKVPSNYGYRGVLERPPRCEAEAAPRTGQYLLIKPKIPSQDCPFYLIGGLERDPGGIYSIGNCKRWPSTADDPGGWKAIEEECADNPACMGFTTSIEVPGGPYVPQCMKAGLGIHDVESPPGVRRYPAEQKRKGHRYHKKVNSRCRTITNLRLREVESYDDFGQIIQPVAASLSSEDLIASEGGANCIDGDTWKPDQGNLNEWQTAGTHLNEDDFNAGTCCATRASVKPKIKDLDLGTPDPVDPNAQTDPKATTILQQMQNGINEDSDPTLTIDFGTSVKLSKIVMRILHENRHSAQGIRLFLANDPEGTDVVWEGAVEDHEWPYQIVSTDFTFNLANEEKNWWTKRDGTHEPIRVKPVDSDPGGEFPIFPFSLSPENIDRREDGSILWETGQGAKSEKPRKESMYYPVKDVNESFWQNPLWTSIVWTPLKCAEVHVAEPFDASSPILEVPSGVVVLNRNDDIEPGTQALRAEQAGAEAVLIINVCEKDAADLFDPVPGSNGLSVTIPVFVIDQVQGAQLVDAVMAISNDDPPVRIDLERADGMFSSTTCMKTVISAMPGSTAMSAPHFDRWNSNLPSGLAVPDPGSWGVDSVAGAIPEGNNPEDVGGAPDPDVDPEVGDGNNLDVDDITGDGSTACLCKAASICTTSCEVDQDAVETCIATCEVDQVENSARNFCSDATQNNNWRSEIPCTSFLHPSPL